MHTVYLYANLFFTAPIACGFDYNDTCGFTVWNDNDHFRWARMPYEALFNDSISNTIQHLDTGMPSNIKTHNPISVIAKIK